MGETFETVQFPMSFAQKRLWFLTQLDPDAPYYNIPANIQLHGVLNIAALYKSLAAIIERHEILRTTFHGDDGQHIQRVHASFEPVVDHVSAPALGKDDLSHWMEQQVEEHLRTPFDLTCGPLVRFRLIKMGTDDHILLCTMHHIVSDGWSMGILIRELSAFYKAFAQGSVPRLPELPIQYGDFADWQHEHLNDDVMGKQLSYWVDQLAGLPPVLDLPLDRERTKVRGWQAEGLSFRMTGPKYDRLHALCRETGTTPYMFCLAVLAVLLGKYSQSDDIAVGSPIANRQQSEMEQLIGFFVNTLVMRVDLSKNDLNFYDLLKQVQKTVLDGFAHQDVAFEQLVEVLEPERHLDLNPLFQVSYSFQNAPMGDMELDGLKVRPLVEYQTGMGRFDLEFSFWEEDGLVGAVLFKKDIFDRATIERMIGHFQTLLDHVLAHPEKSLSDVDMMQEAERLDMIALGAGKTRCSEAEPLLQHQFETQVRLRPNAIALSYENQNLSYRELNERANRLAHELIALGVVPETLVGIYLERSLETVVAVLGILKAGGSYLPLEPAYQNDRLGYMVDDSGIEIVVSTTALQAQLRDIVANQTLHFICLDEQKADMCHDNPVVAQDLDQRAYVIYTSGSTGKPKGVEITQRNVVRLFSTTRGLFDFDHQDVWTMFHSHAFDFSVWEIWGALLNGGRLVVVPYWTTRNPDAFYDLLRTQKVTVLNQTPSAFYALINVDQGADGADDLALRYVIFGGEALDFRKLKPWYERHADDQPVLVNMYGITETTVHASFRALRAGDAHKPQSLIGDPLPDLRFYLLDPVGQPVPIGVKGEIHVGGAGVARGYLNRKELSLERFIRDPFLNNGERLYRSGDLGRWLADGSLEYCGRMDDQIQIRGFRVELGEIQSLLGEHDAIRDCVVLCRQSCGVDEIVAYIVATDENVTFPAMNVRRFLKEKLPDYMIPSHIFAVDEIPLTAHGKIDRRKLQAKEGTALIGAARKPVETPLQQTVFDIWATVLGHTDFGIQDSFFEVGGHSLLATQVVTRLQKQFGPNLTLRTFFEQPRIEEIVFHLNGTGEDEVIPRRSPDCAIPLSYAQERLWFIQMLEGPSAAYNIPSLYRLRGDLDVDALERALNHVIARHENLRTNFVEENGQAFQKIHDDLFIALQVEDWDKDQLHAFLHEPFDLENDALLRWKLVREGQDDYLLAVSIHHIIFDGWSSALLAQEVIQAYKTDGAHSGLDALDIQYGDFALWQRTCFEETGMLDAQLSYWQDQLQRLPSVLDMPCQKARPAVQSYRGKIAHFDIASPVCQGVKQQARLSEGTDFMVLLSVFYMILTRFSGQTDLVVGTPIANRTRAELEKLIGFFVNTLALRVDLSGNPTFENLLARVKDCALGAYAHQDVPFEKLVTNLAVDRSLSHAPIFQVMFVMQNTPLALQSDAQGLEISLEPVEFDAARFDLVFYITEDETGYRGLVEYASDLFEAEIIDHMTQNYCHLLKQVVEKPDQPINNYPLIGTQVTYPGVPWDCSLRVDQIFEQVVQKQPQNRALCFAGQALSYAQLNAQANQVAHYLQKAGVKSGDIVGLMMKRTDRLPVCLLGILKAGAAYLPIEPDYPTDRVQTMIKDSAARLVICDEGGIQPDDVDLVIMDRNAQLCAQESIENPRCEITGDSLVYVLYTSGSTGVPKGVGMGHRAMSNLIQWHMADPVLSQGAQTLHFAPFTFDVSFQEVFSTWATGGCLDLVDEDMRRDFHALVPYVKRQKIERLFMPYVALQQFSVVAQEEGLYPDCLCDVITAGEQLRVTPAIVDLFGHLPDARLHNHYGPSETHVVTSEVLKGDPSLWPLLPAIGFPISGANIYILDKAGHPVSCGGIGEIHVGGEAVALGYLGRADLTAERFVETTFGRLYKTGDLAIWHTDGRIKYLGRADKQVKIRGFRIEPGEVETILNGFAPVRECCVVAHDFAAQSKKLVAYVCFEKNISPDIAGVRSFVRDKLPDYMVPSLFVTLDEMPVTGSGKIDRAKLPAPEENPLDQKAGVMEWRTPVEDILATIWKDVLGGAVAHRQDNFFEAGGHSLLATQLVSRLRAAFSCEITVRQIFETPTFVEIARLMETGEGKSESQIPPIIPLSPEKRTVASFAQERLWFLDRLQGGSSNYNMSVTVSIRGELDIAAFRQSFLEIVRRHEVLRTNFVYEDDHVVCVLQPMKDDIFTICDLSDLSPEMYASELDRLSHDNAVACFDLERDALLAGCLIKTATPDEFIFLLRMHHIVADNWSTGVFLNELATLYQAYRAGEQSPLAELSVQYGDFAHWQREWLNSNNYQRQLDYWIQKLEGVRPDFCLSTQKDENRGTGPCLKHGFVFEDDLKIAVKEVCRQQGVSLYMGLLAAYGVLLYRYSGQNDFVIGSPIANRNHREIEPLIGFFVNMMPMRLQFEPEMTFSELLRCVREITLDGFSRQDVPFEHIVREVCPQRSEERTPLVQNVFVLQNASAQAQDLNGVTMKLLPTPSGAAKFDLVFSVSEEGEQLFGVLEYDSHLFNPTQIEEMMTHFQSLLRQLCQQEGIALIDLDLGANGAEDSTAPVEEFSF
ncbi:amino acid adenylation domain-containing protein [Terasakiella sp.]|uniref:amino acid adenylation domain-containing protein n=1 Tax=Terasakiella sp. TaxID=2034861 RepID=UPI003AA8499D